MRGNASAPSVPAAPPARSTVSLSSLARACCKSGSTAGSRMALRPAMASIRTERSGSAMADVIAGRYSARPDQARERSAVARVGDADWATRSTRTIASGVPTPARAITATPCSHTDPLSRYRSSSAHARATTAEGVSPVCAAAVPPDTHIRTTARHGAAHTRQNDDRRGLGSSTC